MSVTLFVGVDGSEPSAAAVRWSLERASHSHTPIVLAHVVDDEWGLAGRDYALEAERKGASALSEAAHNASVSHPDLTVSTRIVHGSPTWELAELAAPDDLLVVGTHKTGFLHGRVLGSRSVLIASASRSSVAIVPDTTPRGRRGIVVGVDGQEGSYPGIVFGAREAERTGQELLLVHAVPASQGGTTSKNRAEGSVRGEEILDAAVSQATISAPEVTVRRRLVRRRPAEALLDASLTASLLVLGVSHVREKAQTLIGSVTHETLLNITAPVLIIRGSDAAHSLSACGKNS